MVKPATTSSNTPIKHRDRASSPASSSPDSYHYSTKLRCIPPGGRTSPSPSPSPSPSSSHSPTPQHRTTTPPPASPAAQEPTASPTTTCRLTSLTIDDSPTHDSTTVDASKPPPPPVSPSSPLTTSCLPAQAESAYRFPPQTPPPRPRNPLAKQKAFTDPSPIHQGARPTQEQLEALRRRGVGGLFGRFGRGGEEGTSRWGRDGEGEGEGVVEQDEPSSASTSVHADKTDTTVDEDSIAHTHDPTDSDVSTQTLLSHRAHAAAVYEAARLARCAAPEDRDVKTAYVEARAAYDAARRAYANAVMDEEELLEAARKKGKEGRKGKDARKGKDKGKGKGRDMGDGGRGGIMVRQGDEYEDGGGNGQDKEGQPPLPSPTREKQMQKQRGRIASPLERLERSVRRMKANRAI